MKLPIIDNQVALTSDADVSTDVFLGGVRYENSATPKVRATTVSGQYQANGLSFDATGRVFYTDATAGLPAGTTFAGGLPFSPSGALCVSSGPVSTWGNGIPFAANGAVSALFASSALTFGVTLSSVVGGLPASGSGIVTINQVAPVGAITPVITVSRSTGVAPLAVTFDALGTTAPAYTSLPFSEIYYAWTFGDPAGGATWTYGTNPGGNLKNEANGPVAAHVFETDGSYTVTCWAFYLDSGGVLRSGSATTSITVTNANTVFSGTNTICISQNSLPVQGVNGVPADAAVQQVPNWSTVQTLASTYKRILLKRGDTWSTSAGVSLGISQAGPGIIGAYGTGNKPVISATGGLTHISVDASAEDWRIVDIFFTAASSASRQWSKGIQANNSVNTLFLRTDAQWCWNLSQFENANGLYLVDSVLGLGSDETDRGYGSYVSDVSRIAYLGTRIHGVDSFTIRWQGVDRAVLSNCTLDAPKGPQSYARFSMRGKANAGNTGVWNGLWTEYAVVSDNVMVGDSTTQFETLSMGPMNPESAERLRDVIVERNFVTSTTNIASSFAVATGLTVRNNILQALGGAGIDLKAQNNAGSPDASQGFIYNNTIYKANTTVTTGFAGVTLVSRVTGQVIRNNAAYAPGSTSPTMIGGAGVEGVNYTQANNSSNAQVLSTRPWAAVTPVAAVDFTPSASYAVDGGTWVPVYKNYFGTTNAAPREIGAI